MQNELVITPPDKLSELVSAAVKKEINRLESEREAQNTEVFTTHQAMDYLHVSRSTLQRWRNEGNLPYRKVQGKILYTKSDIDYMLEGAAK